MFDLVQLVHPSAPGVEVSQPHVFPVRCPLLWSASMLRLSDALRGNSRGANSTDVGVKILVVHHPSRGLAA